MFMHETSVTSATMLEYVYLFSMSDLFNCCGAACEVNVHRKFKNIDMVQLQPCCKKLYLCLIVFNMLIWCYTSRIQGIRLCQAL